MSRDSDGWRRFNDQFRETHAERTKRLRESYRKQQQLNPYRCTKGHDRCSEMYAGPDCPLCEKRSAP